MKKRRKVIAFLMVCLFVISGLAGCEKEQKEPPIPVTVSEEPKEMQDLLMTNGGTVVTDQLGRRVSIPQQVNKIVSVYYISTSLLIALGVKDAVVGIEMKADTREIYKRAAPEFLSLPQVGSGKGINIEEIAKLEPDLVILPRKLQDSVEQLEELQIPVIVIDPETMKNFQDTISLVSKAVGKEERGRELLQYFQTTMERVSAMTKNLPEKPKVYLSSGADYLRTCTVKMYQNELIQMAGGYNVSIGLTDGYWQGISPEQLTLWNPDYFFIVSYAEYSKEAILADERLAEINAVKDNQIESFPSILEPWDYPTPSSVLGVLWLTNRLHPELVSREEYIQEAASFYKTYFGIQVEEKDLGL